MYSNIWQRLCKHTRLLLLFVDKTIRYNSVEARSVLETNRPSWPIEILSFDKSSNNNNSNERYYFIDGEGLSCLLSFLYLHTESMHILWCRLARWYAMMGKIASFFFLFEMKSKQKSLRPREWYVNRARLLVSVLIRYCNVNESDTCK